MSPYINMVEQSKIRLKKKKVLKIYNLMSHSDTSFAVLSLTCWHTLCVEKYSNICFRYRHFMIPGMSMMPLLDSVVPQIMGLRVFFFTMFLVTQFISINIAESSCKTNFRKPMECVQKNKITTQTLLVLSSTVHCFPMFF